MDRGKAGGRSWVRMGGALAPPRTRLTHKMPSQLPWIDILPHYRATRGSELKLEVTQSSCLDGCFWVWPWASWTSR